MSTSDYMPEFSGRPKRKIPLSRLVPPLLADPGDGGVKGE